MWWQKNAPYASFACFLHCAVDTEDYQKPTHQQFLLFDSYHPLEHKWAPQHRCKYVPTKAEGKQNDHKLFRKALQTFGYPNWASVKLAEKSAQTAQILKITQANVLQFHKHQECLRGIFFKHVIP